MRKGSRDLKELAPVIFEPVNLNPESDTLRVWLFCCRNTKVCIKIVTVI